MTAQHCVRGIRTLANNISVKLHVTHCLQCWRIASHTVVCCGNCCLSTMLERPRVGCLHQQSPSVEGLKPGNYLASSAPAEIHLHQPSQPFTCRGSSFHSLTLTPKEYRENIRTCTCSVKGRLPYGMELGTKTDKLYKKKSAGV